MMYKGFCNICKNYIEDRPQYESICLKCENKRINAFKKANNLVINQPKYILVKNKKTSAYEPRLCYIYKINYNYDRDKYSISLKYNEQSCFERNISEIYDSEEQCLKANKEVIKTQMINIAKKQIIDRLETSLNESIDDDYLNQLIYKNLNNFVKTEVISIPKENPNNFTKCIYSVIDICKQTITTINSIHNQLERLLDSSIKSEKLEKLINEQILICITLMEQDEDLKCFTEDKVKFDKFVNWLKNGTNNKFVNWLLTIS